MSAMTSLIFLYWPSRTVSSSIRRSCFQQDTNISVFCKSRKKMGLLLFFSSKQVSNWTLKKNCPYSSRVKKKNRFHLPFHHLKLAKTPSQLSTSGIPGLTKKNKVLKCYSGITVTSCLPNFGHLMGA